jgi:hypothetical protein
LHSETQNPKPRDPLRCAQSQAAERGRASIAAIVQELWPEKYRRDTRFPLATFPDPRLQVRRGGCACTHESIQLAEPAPRAASLRCVYGAPQGAAFSAAWNATAKEAHVQYRQANKVWSLIHTLVANTADPMRAASVEASRALAVWLRQHFMCTNCRGAGAASQPRAGALTDACRRLR